MNIPITSARRWLWLVALLFALMVVAGGCTQRFRDHQERQTPDFRPPTEAFSRLVLLREANKLLRAEFSYQWASYRFHQGVCFPGTIEEMEREDQRAAITAACGELRSIQESFPHPCTGDTGCPVSEQARNALDSVIVVLNQAESIFAEAEAAASGIPSSQ